MTRIAGVLWVWERMLSRKRERQLSEAHNRLTERGEELTVLVDLVRQNTRAMVEVERVQRRMCELLQEISHEIRREDRAA